MEQNASSDQALTSGAESSLPESTDAERDETALSMMSHAGQMHRQDRLPKEFKKALIATITWCLLQLFKHFGFSINLWVSAFIDLAVGLVIIQVACQAIIAGTERLAARFKWDQYVAGTWSEILSTLPEIVVVAFLVPVNPFLAFTMVMITIYNNSLVFSCYSFFLPKDVKGKYLMPKPITEVGTQILVAGGSLGLIMGAMMLGLVVTKVDVQGFNNVDLIFIAMVLLLLFVIYMYRLTVFYATDDSKKKTPSGTQKLKFKLDLIEIYQAVQRRSWATIIGLFFIGVGGSFLGGVSVNDFAVIMTQELNVDAFITAFFLAAFGGMSEYVILLNAHRRKDYGIALANAFGGMTQVMFLILPFTLLFGAYYSLMYSPAQSSWLVFNTASILLFAFLFPTFYTLTALLEEDHTFDLLDTAVMVSIVTILIYLLMSYGNGVN